MRFTAAICFIIIMMVSVIDQYCLIKYVTYQEELNPIGRYLLILGGIPLFAATKMFGTIVVLSLLIIGCYHNLGFWVKVMIGLAIFQLWLLAFLWII